jgi:uncharacterized protein (TIGR03083 family)
MENAVGALRASVDRLHALASGLDDAQLVSPSYCDDWSIAQVLSHLGSGAVIARRGLQDVRAGTPTPDDFNQSVWDEWNAKAPRAQADESLLADAALIEAYEEVPEAERADLTFSLGPVSLGFDEMAGMRLNEHAFHTWDIAVALDDAAVVPEDAAAVVVDNLALIARFSGRADGLDRTIAVRTSAPARDITVRLSADGVEVGAGEPGQPPDLELPAEAFSRLVYGRLDPEHTPTVVGDDGLVSSLRAVFPGP